MQEISVFLDNSDKSDQSRSYFAATKKAAPRRGCGSIIRVGCVYRLFHNFVDYITANTDVETLFRIFYAYTLEVVVDSFCIVSGFEIVEA